MHNTGVNNAAGTGNLSNLKQLGAPCRTSTTFNVRLGLLLLCPQSAVNLPVLMRGTGDVQKTGAEAVRTETVPYSETCSLCLRRRPHATFRGIEERLKNEFTRDVGPDLVVSPVGCSAWQADSGLHVPGQAGISTRRRFEEIDEGPDVVRGVRRDEGTQRRRQPCDATGG